MPFFEVIPSGKVVEGVVWDGEPSTLVSLNKVKNIFSILGSGVLATGTNFLATGTNFWLCPVGSLVYWTETQDIFVVNWIPWGEFEPLKDSGQPVVKSQGDWNPFENI